MSGEYEPNLAQVDRLALATGVNRYALIGGWLTPLERHRRTTNSVTRTAVNGEPRATTIGSRFLAQQSSPRGSGR
jgi:hypothetical protein